MKQWKAFTLGAIIALPISWLAIICFYYGTFPLLGIILQAPALFFAMLLYPHNIYLFLILGSIFYGSYGVYLAKSSKPVELRRAVLQLLGFHGVCAILEALMWWLIRPM